MQNSNVKYSMKHYLFPVISLSIIGVLQSCSMEEQQYSVFNEDELASQIEFVTWPI